MPGADANTRWPNGPPGVEVMTERLVAAGATRVRTLSEPGLDHYAVALLDPEGNEFDVD